MTFDKFKDFVTSGAKRNFEKYGKIEPMFIMVLHSGIPEIIPLNDLYQLGKEKMSEFLRNICDHLNPVYTAHVCEAHILKFTSAIEFEKHIDGQGRYKNTLLKPANHPDAINTLVISICTNDGIRNNVVYKIVDPVIKKPHLEHLDDYDSSHVEGLFANLI